MMQNVSSTYSQGGLREARFDYQLDLKDWGSDPSRILESIDVNRG